MLIGAVSGLDHKAAALLQARADGDAPEKLRLLVVLSAACPTTRDVLLDLWDLQKSSQDRFQFWLYAHPDNVTSPTNILWARCGSQCGSVFIGADQNLLLDPATPTKLTLGLPLSLQQEERLRQWFDWLIANAALLTEANCAIPRLVRPEGTEEGRRLWEEYAASLAGERRVHVAVDPETGEVAAKRDDGARVETLTSSGTTMRVGGLAR